MHDIDSPFMEYSPETEHFEAELFEFGQAELAAEVFGEAELLEVATELLEVANEAELNHFLGGLIRKAAGAVRRVVSLPVGQALGSILKSAAGKALPIGGSANGGYVGGPAGATIGDQIASGAGQVFGLETEGLSHEDELFETAKQYVRFAGDAVKNAVMAPAGVPNAVARAAVGQAAQRFAPGLVAGSASPTPTGGVAARQGIGRGRAGRWVRRGNRIVLYGA